MKGDKNTIDMRRREFIKKSILSGAAFSIGGDLLAESASIKEKKLTILHTNDMHSRIEPFPNDGGRWADQGGMTKLSSVIQKIRQQEEHILLLDSGDVFQGTPYFNFFGGEVEYKLMSKMGYDATTIGNHEFDNGLKGLYEQLPNAGFSHIISNYDFSNTILKDSFLPYKIFKKGGLKIGVFGLGIELNGLVGAKSYENTKYLDPIPVAREMVQEFQSKKCDLIVCLSHLGYSYRSNKIDDLKLAAQVEGIDLILGGHSHTFLDEPTLVKSSGGFNTLVNQVGTGAVRLGKIEYEFSTKSEIRNVSARSIEVY